jgi:hypothetical protein
MTFTMSGRRVPYEWMPLAMANGIEWSLERRGMPDRFDCLYKSGPANKMLWYVGAFLAIAYRPQWAQAKP